MAQRTIKARLYSYLRQNHTSKWSKAIDGIISALNDSRHSGIYGLLPSQVDKPISGDILLKTAQDRFGSPQSGLSEQEQKEYKDEFYSNSENHKYYRPGQIVLADIAFSKKILKGHNLKRGVLCKILKLDFTQKYFGYT